MNSTSQNTSDKTDRFSASRQGANPRAQIMQDVFTYRFRHIPEYVYKRLPCKQWREISCRQRMPPRFAVPQTTLTLLRIRLDITRVDAATTQYRLGVSSRNNCGKSITNRYSPKAVCAARKHHEHSLDPGRLFKKSNVEILARNIVAFRENHCLSQEDFADMCHLHRTYIGSIERYERNVSLKTLEAIAKGIGIPLFLLFIPSRLKSGDIAK